MGFTRITDEDKAGKGNVGQPDTPLLSATDMQAQMDSLPNLAIDRFNGLCSELEGGYAPQYIGCPVPTSMSQTIPDNLFSIINELARLCAANESYSHTHYNKESLDLLSSTIITKLIELATLLSSIELLQTSITAVDTAIPTSNAVVKYIQTANIAGNILNSIYPIGAIYQTTTTDPDTLFGTTGKWTLVKTEDGIKTYRRNG